MRNLTGGKVSDSEVNRWVVADERRTVGDQWAISHLRLDLIQANVLGSPGLTGDSEAVASLRAKGVTEVSTGSYEFQAATVLAVPPDLRGGQFGLSDFVIVFRFKVVVPTVATYADGRTETLGPPVGAPLGTVASQLDAGRLRSDPTIGDVWYQSRGYGCAPGASDPVDQLCATAFA